MADTNHYLNGGVEAHKLTNEERARGGKNRWRNRNEAIEQAKREFAAELAELDLEMLDIIRKQANDPDEDPGVRQRAAMYLIDRKHGKPTQKTEQDHTIHEELKTATQSARGKIEAMLKGGS